MSVLTVQPLLRHLKDRLRVNYVDESLYSDDDILTMLNDAYLDACEQALILRTLVTISIASGTQEYTLPSDFSQLIYAVAGGRHLDPITYQQALTDPAFITTNTGYYTYANKIGLVPTPTDATSGQLMILYAATPAPLVTFDDGLDARFPVEYADLLLHWVRWRVQIISGGAERIGQANIDRTLYDNRVAQMRRTADSVKAFAPMQLTHVSDRSRRLISAS